MTADVGSWAWGTAQGAFNEKASLSQILVDAVIGMIPLVGDVTAVRDIIAVVIRLIDDPDARESVWEWVLLVVLVFALIPVVGGGIKGVGRGLEHLAQDAPDALDDAPHDRGQGQNQHDQPDPFPDAFTRVRIADQAAHHGDDVAHGRGIPHPRG
ncbi:hypothetical protein DXO200_11045, partial [Xanthomonas oryzae pv. oryzae]